jgi:polysaccharide export outer membrane protein
MSLAASPPTTDVQRPRARCALGPLALAALALGCATVDKDYVWVDTLAVTAEEGPYVVAPGDVLSVQVFNQDRISGNFRVRPDGKITVMFVNDIEAAGLTPGQLAQRIQARLSEFLVSPVVTVALHEARALEVTVIGEVQRVGIYRLEQGAGVLTALAAASGLSDFAHRDRIFVVRNGAIRIRFTYKALSLVQERAAQFRLRPGDIVVVE